MLNNWSSRRPGVRTLAAAATIGAAVALVLPATASAAPGIEESVQGSIDSGSATINGSVGDIGNDIANGIASGSVTSALTAEPHRLRLRDHGAARVFVGHRGAAADARRAPPTTGGASCVSAHGDAPGLLAGHGA